jgi:hypothetical protein
VICNLTQESILDTLLAFGGVSLAHEVFAFLLDGEFPDRRVLLTPEAETELRNLPRSPGEEDPDVSSHQQVLTLFRTFTIDRRMILMRDYRPYDRKMGIWKWKTRTVRMAGIYVSGQRHFVIAHVGFARLLKRGGKSSTEKEAEFSLCAANRLAAIGLLEHAWIVQDPHYDPKLSFDPY